MQKRVKWPPLGAVLVGALLLLSPRAGFSQKAPPKGEVDGVVLAIEQEDLILDIGADRGASEGTAVEIWRPLKLKHPVTGKVFSDRFLIGTLTLGQVRPSISLAKPAGSLSRVPLPGDVVIMAAKAVEAPALPSPATAAEPSAPPSAEPLDPEVAAISKMFDRLRGASEAERIRAYEDYVRTQPQGRFARVLYEEAQALRKLYELQRKAGVKEGDEKAGDKALMKELAPILLNFAKPSEAIAGEPLHIALELNDRAAGAVFHLRREDEAGYTSFPMTPLGSGYYSVAVPPEKVSGEQMKYFVEAAESNGQVSEIVGTSREPEQISVIKPAAPELKSTARPSAVVLSDYADYNGLKGNDRVWQTEGFFQMRYGDIGVRALRTGFGVYRGVGGSVEDLDIKNLKPREVGLTYGYVETEFGIVKAFSLIGRVVVGLDEEGVSGGGQVLLRIGSDLQTNLVLGSELLGGIGLRGFTQLELNTIERVPILLRIEVTNQPAGGSASRADVNADDVSTGAGQVGGRGIVQVGYKVIDPLVVSLRGSFQGRTINHAGPGFGAAVSYQW